MIYPIFAMVALTLIVWLQMYYVRLSEMKRHRIDPEEMNAFNRDLPRRIVTSGDNLRNLFEMPVLFYTAAILIMVTDRSDEGFVYLGWSFVALRYLHSYIHVGYNQVLHRFIVYAISSIILWFIWIRFAWMLVSSTH